MVASYTQGKWEIGKICSLTYGQQKWIEYLHLPQVKSQLKKDKGRLINQELNHEFKQDEYTKTWVFIKEAWEAFLTV